jgi:hypothetical protein
MSTLGQKTGLAPRLRASQTRPVSLLDQVSSVEYRAEYDATIGCLRTVSAQRGTGKPRRIRKR